MSNNSVPQPRMVNSKQYQDNYSDIDWGRNKKDDQVFKLDSCPFNYCDSPEICKEQNKCRYTNNE